MSTADSPLVELADRIVDKEPQVAKVIRVFAYHLLRSRPYLQSKWVGDAVWWLPRPLLMPIEVMEEVEVVPWCPVLPGAWID
jgi:hypothetical protein